MELCDLHLEFVELLGGLCIESLQCEDRPGEAGVDVCLQVRLNCSDLLEGGAGLFTDVEEGLRELGADLAEFLGDVASEVVDFIHDGLSFRFGAHLRFQGDELLMHAVHGTMEVVQVLAGET